MRGSAVRPWACSWSSTSTALAHAPCLPWMSIRMLKVTCGGCKVSIYKFARCGAVIRWMPIRMLKVTCGGIFGLKKPC